MVASLVWQRIYPDNRRSMPQGFYRIRTLLLVSVAWVFFRAPSLQIAWTVLSQPFVNPLGNGVMQTLDFLEIYGMEAFSLVAVVITWIITERFPEDIYQDLRTGKGLSVAAAVFVSMVTAIEFSWLSQMAAGSENAFIYFRF